MLMAIRSKLLIPFGLTIAGALYWQRFEKELRKMEEAK